MIRIIKKSLMLIMLIGLMSTSFNSVANADLYLPDKDKKQTQVTYKTKKARDAHPKDHNIIINDDTKVWIAPISGTKYHFLNHSQHFGNAKSKKIVTLKWAKEHGYKLGK